MDRNIPPIPAVVFLSIFVGLIAFYAVRSTDISYMPIQQVVVDHQGKIWALFETDLVDISTDSEILSLADLGIKNHVGQVIALNGGGWIINKGAQDNFLIRAIRRIREDENTLYQNKGSILRCSEKLSDCIPWGEAELQFERSFDGIEMNDGRLILVNPTKRAVYLVSKSGIIQDQVDGKEYWFGVSRVDDQSYIATDKNRENFDQISIDGNQLIITNYEADAKKLSSDTESIKGLSKSFVEDDSLWVMASKSGEKKLRRIDLTNDSHRLDSLSVDYADLADFELIDKALYFTEYDKHELKKYNLQQDSLSLVESSLLSKVEEVSAIEKDKIKSEIFKVLLLGGFGLLGCFVFLIKKSTPLTEKQKKERGGIFNQGFDLRDPVKYPVDVTADLEIQLSKNGIKLNRMINISIVVNIIIVVLMGCFLVMSDYLQLDLSNPHFMYLGGFTLLTISYFIFVSISAKPKRLFVKHGQLHWQKNNERIFTFEPKSLIYTRNLIADQSVVAMLYNHKHGLIYDYDMVEKFVVPILHQGSNVSEIAFYKHQVKHNSNKALIHLAFVTCLLFLMYKI